MNKALYQLAFSFKYSKVWETIYEEELFAVELDGEIGYCQLLGLAVSIVR